MGEEAEAFDRMSLLNCFEATGQPRHISERLKYENVIDMLTKALASLMNRLGEAYTFWC